MAELNHLSLFPAYMLGTEIVNHLSWVLGAILVVSASLRSVPGYYELETAVIATIKERWRKNTQTIKIHNDDSLYYIILNWAGKQEQLAGRDHLIATVDLGSYSVRLRQAFADLLTQGASPTFTPDSGSVSFQYEGETVTFTRSIDRKRPGDPKEIIEFSTQSKNISLSNLVNQIYEEHKKTRPQEIEVYRPVPLPIQQIRRPTGRV
ncbi:mitochondrial chaperone BCS1 [Colletotrichum tofieldiae]|nr:mitochondrial chaperone BCS1 [Colletotrichum tofieldiae]